MKLFSPDASDVSIAAAEYHVTDSSSPLRVPSQSSILPVTVCITA